jgi:hypothetical protein
MAENLIGRRVNESELRNIFPGDEIFGEVIKGKRTNQGVIFYERPFKSPKTGTSRIAYLCDSCDTITVGPLQHK